VVEWWSGGVVVVIFFRNITSFTPSLQHFKHSNTFKLFHLKGEPKKRQWLKCYFFLTKFKNKNLVLDKVFSFKVSGL